MPKGQSKLKLTNERVRRSVLNCAHEVASAVGTRTVATRGTESTVFAVLVCLKLSLEKEDWKQSAPQVPPVQQCGKGETTS